VEYVRDALGRHCVTERRECRILEQPRSTQRRCRHVPSDEPRLIRRIVELATEYGRYGYRRVTALLHREGWQVNQTNRADLASRRTKSPAEPAEASAALIEFWFLRASQAHSSELRLELRLRGGQNGRRSSVSDAGDRRRAHA
jgi:hypothetical protein